MNLTVSLALALLLSWILPLPAARAQEDDHRPAANPTPTSLPIDWSATGWSRWELASLDIGVMNGSAYGEIRGFGYHRAWIPGLGRLGLGFDLLDAYGGKQFSGDAGLYSDVATETLVWLPMRATFALWGKVQFEEEVLYEILSARRMGTYTVYRYRELGTVPRALVSPLVVVGVAGSPWGTRTLSDSDFPDFEQDFRYVDVFLEVSYGMLLNEPPHRAWSGVVRATIGVMMWDARESANLPAASGTDIYLKVGFGAMGYEPSR